jgi:hypothetical protein
MDSPFSNRANHFSIIWAMTLAVLTIVEWRSLDREPMKEQVLLPFIERNIRLDVTRGGSHAEAPAQTGTEQRSDKPLHYEVEVGFNGPLFLLCLFGPVLLFQGIAWGAGRLSRRGRD